MSEVQTRVAEQEVRLAASKLANSSLEEDAKLLQLQSVQLEEALREQVSAHELLRTM